MQTRYTGQITAPEWRWVMVFGTGLALIVLLPFLLVPFVLNDPAIPRVFMGVMHDAEGSASALASVRLGMQDQWLWRALHTPEAHNGVIANGIYILVGQIARVTGLDALSLFHIGRVLAAVFMFHAIYVLGAAIWLRVTSRRLFWIIASVGAGLGWLYTPLTGELPPDVTPSLLFPFHAALMNVHLPLAVGCMCFLAAAMIDSLRPDNKAYPSVTNSGLSLIVFSLTLALIYAQALAPLAIAYAAMLILDTFRRGEHLRRGATWFLWFAIPALPLTVYNLTVFFGDPMMSELWTLQTAFAAPPILLLIVALGLPLLIALPGIWRGLRRFEPDGSAFMLVWLAAMLVLAYFAPVIRGEFLLGLMLPVAYFVARACEDFWFPRLSSRALRYGIVAALLPVIGASQAVTLFAPAGEIAGRLSLPRDYLEAFGYLGEQRVSSVVVAVPTVSLWLPVWTGKQVVYASPALTIDAETKRDAVIRFYRASDPAECEALLNGAVTSGGPYTVRYVIVGPEERALSDSVCVDGLTEVARFDEVTVYSR